MYLSEGAAEPLHFGVSNIQVMPGIMSIRTRRRVLACTHTQTHASTPIGGFATRWKSMDCCRICSRLQRASLILVPAWCWVPPSPGPFRAMNVIICDNRHHWLWIRMCLVINFTVFAPTPRPFMICFECIIKRHWVSTIIDPWAMDVRRA